MRREFYSFGPRPETAKTCPARNGLREDWSGTRFELAEGDVGINVLDQTTIELPGVIGSGMPGSNGQRRPEPPTLTSRLSTDRSPYNSDRTGSVGGYSHPLEWQRASLRTNSLVLAAALLV
jgi:hypothetical protein